MRGSKARMITKLKDTLRANLPWLVDWWHRLQGAWASFRWGNPSQSIKIIGVTGTNGKTTTASMIAQILEEAGHKVGMLNSYEFKIAQKRVRNDTLMTTLPPGFLSRLLRQMVEAECEYAVLEVSSHAIAQHRIAGIRPRVVVFTNLTHEHLDYHKTLAEYRRAKLKLFAHSPHTSVINSDDPSAPYFLKLPAGRHYTYSLEKRADVTARKILPESGGTLFTAVTPIGQVVIDLKVPGRFNVSNALAAIAVGLAEGVGLEVHKKALEKFEGVPGRMERVRAGQDFDVIVDFALTPDALQKIYETIKPTVKGRLISVFGAAGRRDKSKRPIMGAIAGRWADVVVLTTEDPYDEDPLQIIGAIAKGVPRGAKHHKKVEGKDFFIIPDRAQAIRFALQLARRGDTVLITGKGGERWMVTAEGKIPWDDAQVVKQYLQK